MCLGKILKNAGTSGTLEQMAINKDRGWGI